ncbi:MAG: FG-GAP repeat protein [Planctomycetota bacterium]
MSRPIAQRWRAAVVACLALAVPSGVAGTAEVAELTASDGAVFDELGARVAIDRDVIAVGQPDIFRRGPGAVYAFVRPPEGWATATETTKLVPADGQPRDSFGDAVAVSGGVIAVGAQGAQISGSRRGAVYVFEAPAVVASSGCGLGAPVATGSRRLGGAVALAMDPCAPSSAHAFVLGAPLATPFEFGAAIACGGRAACRLSVRPGLLVPGPAAPIAIPNLGVLVGITLAVQGARAEPVPASCLALTDMVTTVLSS